MVADDLPTLPLSDSRAWDAWLSEHGDQTAGVWVVVAKKGFTAPTLLTFDEALDVACAHGWVDVQNRRRDDTSYLLRFMPRRAHSSWGATNVRRVERLLAEGRMRPRGLAEVARAKADGRWPVESAAAD